MIKVGDRVPGVALKRLGANGMEEFNTEALFKGRTTVIFGVPGAFTPTCSNKHLPGFILHAEDLKQQGADEVFCLSVNDAYVMKAWEDSTHSAGKVSMIPDGNGEFTEKMGLTLDGSGFGLGKRCKRFAMVVKDGAVDRLQVEPAGGMTCSSADDVLKMMA